MNNLSEVTKMANKKRPMTAKGKGETMRKIEYVKRSKVASCLVFGMILLATAPALAADKPNVILIITDDMGWGDPGSYGFDRGVKTPSLDRIAAEGIRFTNWYGEASVVERYLSQIY
jgi:hypothetical protein